MQTGADPRHGAGAPPRSLPWGMWLGCALACGLTALLVFFVALHVPVRALPTISTSYMAGYNNSFAILCAVGISFLVLVFTWWWTRRTPKPSLAMPAGQGVGWPLLLVVMALSALIVGFGGMFVVHSHLRYMNDAGYFVEQASVYHDTGRALYSQIEFAYGPLLLLPTVVLSRVLGIATMPAYFVGLVLTDLVGLLLLAFVLQELPMRPGLRRLGLVLVAFGVLVPELGMNYTLLRFVTPLAVLLYATRSDNPWRATGLLIAGECLVLLISPEIGIALSVGMLAFGLLRALRDRRWLLAAFVPVTVLALLLLTLGRPYLRMTAAFSRGALNLPIGPYPHIVILLFALVWMVPFGLGRILRPDERNGARLAGAYVLSLALMPAALNRCDALHVFFDGLCLLLLSLVAASFVARPARLTWACCLLVLVVWMQYSVEYTSSPGMSDVFRRTLLHHVPVQDRIPLRGWTSRFNVYAAAGMLEPIEPEQHLDLSRFNALVGPGTPVATPLDISLSIEADLKASHHYSPEFYSFWVDMLNAQTERRSIDDVNRYRWMLLPAGVPGSDFDVFLPRKTWVFQHLNLHYKQRHPAPYLPGVAFEANLHSRWQLVAKFGTYGLYRQHDAAAPTLPGAP